jgi:hypothetical protein
MYLLWNVLVFSDYSQKAEKKKMKEEDMNHLNPLEVTSAIVQDLQQWVK